MNIGIYYSSGLRLDKIIALSAWCRANAQHILCMTEAHLRGSRAIVSGGSVFAPEPAGPYRARAQGIPRKPEESQENREHGALPRPTRPRRHAAYQRAASILSVYASPRNNRETGKKSGSKCRSSLPVTCGHPSTPLEQQHSLRCVFLQEWLTLHGVSICGPSGSAHSNAEQAVKVQAPRCRGQRGSLVTSRMSAPASPPLSQMAKSPGSRFESSFTCFCP